MSLVEGSLVEGPALSLVEGRANPNYVSVILYTSGTTADPKGVLHSDNTLLSECRTMARYHELSAAD
ncbi:MAG: AMP-binding protein, partial [Nitrospiraceae bacterium]